jgi:hypothetical protein
METQKIEVSLEDFKCRIPALFPYMEWNADGTVETHVATDSENGCYGKIVDNMKTPADVRLTNYVQIQENEVHQAYTWNDANTIGLSEDLRTYFANSGASYLRKAILYSYIKLDTEEIPEAVFVEELPNEVTDNSPEFVKTPKTGLDGMIVGCENVTLYDYYEKQGVYYYYARVDIIKPCETYSYRTIINEYYKYKDIVGSGNSFVKFVENGIGYIPVERRLLNLENKQKYPEVPDFVYLSQVRKIKAKYDMLRKAYIHYNNYYLANGKASATLKAKSDKYVRMGGDNFTNWLGQMEQKCYDVANYYKCRSDNKDYPARFTSNVMLSKRSQILGLEEVFENVFVPGKRYYDGDLLTFEGKTYICRIDRLIPNGDNYLFIRKAIEINGIYAKTIFELNETQDEYIPISNENITYTPSTLWEPETYITAFVVVDGNYYRWNEDTERYDIITVREYSTGIWDDETERYVFDWQHFIPITEVENYNKWYDDTNLLGKDYKFFADLDYIPLYKVHDYIRYNDSIFEWDDESAEYVPVDGDENKITFTTNSKLRDLRFYREYVSPFGVSEAPGLEEDWLYYYKVGNITGKVVETDEFGNIVSDSADFIVNQRCYDLHAYGNVIKSITYNNEDNTLTFNYVMGAHLTAVADYSDTDVDGNVIRYYRDFAYDEESGDGIVFTETYKCKDDSVMSLGTDFEEYIRGDAETMLRYSYDKFPFETIPLESVDGSMYIEGSATAFFDVYANLQHSRTVKPEWMNGLYHQPKVKANVSIDRGNGASFERHLRLGEIDTMEDFENYQNGSFYKISES